MPTPKQIYEMREAQNALGLSDEQFYCNDYSLEQLSERNNIERKIEPFKGEEIGTYILNRKTGESKFFIYKSRGRK